MPNPSPKPYFLAAGIQYFHASAVGSAPDTYCGCIPLENHQYYATSFRVPIAIASQVSWGREIEVTIQGTPALGTLSPALSLYGTLAGDQAYFFPSAEPVLGKSGMVWVGGGTTSIIESRDGYIRFRCDITQNEDMHQDTDANGVVHNAGPRSIYVLYFGLNQPSFDLRTLDGRGIILSVSVNGSLVAEVPYVYLGVPPWATRIRETRVPLGDRSYADVFTGVLQHDVPLFAARGPGVPLQLQLTYSSDASLRYRDIGRDVARDRYVWAPFGQGWAFTYGLRVLGRIGELIRFDTGVLDPSSSDDLLVQDPWGRVVVYHRDPGNTAYTPLSSGWLRDLADRWDIAMELTGDSATGYTIKSAQEGGPTYHFDNQGRLIEIKPRSYGISTTITWSSTNFVVTDASGRTATFTIDANGHVTTVVDPAQQTWTFAYDGQSLTGITAPDGHQQAFSYDDQRYVMTTRTDARGTAWSYGYTFGPASEQRMLWGSVASASCTDSIRGTLTRQITYRNDPSNPDRTCHVEFRDAAGFTTAYDLTIDFQDSAGQPGYHEVDVTTPDGAKTIYSYLNLDPHPRFIGAPNGDATGYDRTNGVLSGVTFPDGSYMSYTFETWNRVQTYTDASNVTETYTYTDLPGALDLVTQITRPAPFAGGTPYTVTYAWAGPGDMTEEHEGAVERVLFDYYDMAPHRGLPKQSTHCEGTAVVGHDQWEYDNFGQVTLATCDDGTHKFTYDPWGRLLSLSVQTLSNPPLTRTIQRDGSGAMMHVVEFTGDVIDYTYDAEGLMTSEKVTATDGTIRTSTFAYDKNGNVAASTNFDGEQLAYQYDSVNRTTQVTYDSGVVVAYQYDMNGRIIGETVTPPGGGAPQRRDIAYDKRGNVNSVQYPSVPLPDGSGGQWRPTTTVDRHPNLRVKRVQEQLVPGLTSDVQYDLDASGRPYTVRRTIGGTEFASVEALNELGFLDRVDGPTAPTPTTVDPLADVQPANGRTARGTRSVTFDCRGRLESMKDETGTVIGRLVHDNADRPTELHAPDPGTPDQVVLQAFETRVYDDLNRETTVSNAAGSVVSVAYDASGNLQTKTSSAGFAELFTYDADGRVTTISRTAAAVAPLNTVYTYNVRNSLTAIEHDNVTPDGTVVPQSYAMTYDPLGRLTQKSDPLGRCATMAYTAMGELQSHAIGGQGVQYTYDGFGRIMTATEQPSGEVTSFAYDAAGNMTFAENGTSRCTWRYDEAGRVCQRTILFKGTNVAKTLHYQYDTFGQLCARRDDKGAKIRYQYDAGDRLTGIYIGDDPTPSIVQDRTTWGGLLHRSIIAASVTSSYNYDVLSNVGTVTHIGPNSFQANVTVVRDAFSRVISRTRTTPNFSSTFDYDAASRLTRQVVVDPNGKNVVDEGYAYDAIGNRVATTRATETMQCMYDAANQLTNRTVSPHVTVDPASITASADSEMDANHPASAAVNGDVRDSLDAGAAWISAEGDVEHTLTLTLAQPTAINLVDLRMPSVLGRFKNLRLEGRHPNTATWQPMTALLVQNGTSGGQQFDVLGPQARILLTTMLVDAVRLVRPVGGGCVDATDSSYRTRLAVVDVAIAAASAPTPGSVTTFTYDDAGRRTGKATTMFDYDGNGRIVAAHLPAGDIAYSYHPDGRLAMRKNTASGELQHFVWDGIQLFGEYDPQGNPIRTYLLSPESAVPLGYLEWQSGGTIARRFFLHDDRGTPTHVINNDGSVSATYVLDAFGRELVVQESAPQPLRYFSKWADPTIRVLTWPLRHYDPDTADFFEKDPRSGAYAPYVFLGNDPASQQDDLGASWWDTLVETIKELPGTLYEDFSSGAAAHRLQTFAVGVGQGAKGAVEGTVHAVCHPVETVTGIAHVVTHPSEVLHALGQQWDDLLRKAANDPEAFAEAVGRLCGEQMVAAITQAGTARALEAVKDLGLVSKARSMFSRRARCTRIPESLQSIERPPCAMREVVQLGKRPSRFRVGVKRAIGAYNGKEWNICHTVSSEMLKSSIQKIVNAAEDQWELLGRRGYHPSKFGGSVQRAARKWYLDGYNNIENLSLGLAKENQLSGSLIPRTTGTMKFVLRVDEPEIAFMGWVIP